MQIQMGEGVGLKRGEGVLGSTADGTVCTEIESGERVPQRNVVETAQERICFAARQRDTECARRTEFFGLKRVVSCGSGDHGWRTKLDLGGGEPLDDLHGSATVGTAIKIRNVFGGGSALFDLWLW